MVEFKFIEYGTDFGTRDMGQKLREKLLPLINGNEKVVLDFTGVNVVSNSFADECIAKLLLESFYVPVFGKKGKFFRKRSKNVLKPL